jgi:hypothetical protein
MNVVMTLPLEVMRFLRFSHGKWTEISSAYC